MSLAGFPAPSPDSPRDHKGRFRRVNEEPIPTSAEIATVWKGDFLSPLSIYQYPNLSSVIRYRSEGQGIRFYETMIGTDPDLAGFFQDLNDDVLHNPMVVRAASDRSDHRYHAAFLKFAIKHILGSFTNFLRHVLDAHARGFSVTEKVYEVVDRGEWTGAVVYRKLFDKPQRWWSFDPDRNLRFRTVQNIYPGELVDQSKFIVATFGTNSDPWGRAVLDLCYLAWFLKHHALEHQAIFFEKWASPTTVAEYKASQMPGADEANKRALGKALEIAMSVQRDQAVAMPSGIVLKLIESARNGTISFEQYIDQLTKMESRAVTGQILSSMGDKGGSYALGKVHEKRESNKVDMLAIFAQEVFNEQCARDLVDRNFGPQDAYPRLEILSRDLLEKQAWLEIEQSALANGHKVSRAWSDEVLQAVLPEDPSDELVPSPVSKPSQILPVPAGLADDGEAGARIALAHSYAGLRDALAPKARSQRAHHEKVTATAAKKAKPAITKIVKALGSGVAKKKTLKGARHAVYSKLRSAPIHGLGGALAPMLSLDAVSLAGDGPTQAPPKIPTGAKLAVALQVVSIADRIADAANDAPEDMTPEDFAKSLTDPNGVAVDAAYSGLFEAIHGTNVASIATGKLLEQLNDPKFRKSHPYVMILTEPDARLPHKVLDGYIINSEDARFFPLPPFSFGCRCQAVPISAETAKGFGLTGAKPTGTVESYVAAKGGLPRGVSPGLSPGFVPAAAETDVEVQLDALRQKAEELRAEDPEAWVELRKWLIWLFLGTDILREDPPPED